MKRINSRVRGAAAVDFFNLLTGPELLELTESHLPEHRERLYSPTVTLSVFIKQALSEDGSCQRAVNGWAAQCTAEGLPFQSVRTGGYCRGQQLGARDHLVSWPKPKQRPQWMTVEQFKAYPNELTLREVKVKGQVLVTTLLDGQDVSKQDLAILYGRRWQIELDFRNIKTTLGMDVLRCRSA